MADQYEDRHDDPYDEEDITEELNRRDGEYIQRIEEYRRQVHQSGQYFSQHQLSTVDTEVLHTSQEPLSPALLENNAVTENTANSTVKDFDDILIQNVKPYTIIWAVNGKGYKDSEKRNRAWIEIGNIVGVEPDVLKTRWKNLRDGFMKAIKKRNDYYKSGRGNGKLPTCQCFEQLLFLRDSVSNKTNKSTNISINLNAINANTDATQAQRDILQTSPTGGTSFQSPTGVTPLSETSNSRSNISTGTDIDDNAITNFSKPSKAKRALQKRKGEDRRDGIDALLIKTLASCDNGVKENIPQKEESSDMLFCKSLVPILEKLPKKKNRRARIKIQEVLMEFESDSE